MLALGGQVFLPMISSPYFQRYEVPYPGLRVPFGAYVEFLPSSRIAAESTPNMARRLYQESSLGIMKNVHGMTNDYIVISLALLHEAKCYPNDPLSWRSTPQRGGRLILNATMTPQFPLEPGYDARRESILQQDLSTGR